MGMGMGKYLWGWGRNYGKERLRKFIGTGWGRETVHGNGVGMVTSYFTMSLSIPDIYCFLT